MRSYRHSEMPAAFFAICQPAAPSGRASRPPRSASPAAHLSLWKPMSASTLPPQLRCKPKPIACLAKTPTTPRSTRHSPSWPSVSGDEKRPTATVANSEQLALGQSASEGCRSVMECAATWRFGKVRFFAVKSGAQLRISARYHRNLIAFF